MPLKFDSISYGSFEIEIKLFWKKEIKMPDESKTFTCTHDLKFETKGKSRIISLKFSKDNI